MFDIIIRDGKIADGSGAKPLYRSDVGIKDGEIFTISNLEEEVAEVEINARGKIVSPGFIDLNTHSDTRSTLFKYPDQESLVKQGVTTIVGGNCGSSLAPILGEGSIKTLRKWVNLGQVQIDWDRIGEFLDFLEDNLSLRVNFATLVGHATLRRGLIGEDISSLKKKELEVLGQEIERALKEGAFGLSTGLSYTHLRSVDQKELNRVAQVLSEAGGIFSVHLRNEGEDLIKSVKEIVEVAEKTGVNTEISHFKVLGKKAWPLFDRALNIIEEAGKLGTKINFDLYPYAFSEPILYTLLPNWLTEKNRETLIKKLKHSRIRQRAIREMEKSSINYNKLIIASCPFSQFLVKRSVEEVAKSRGVSAAEVVIDLLLASEDQSTVIAKLISERNVKKALSSDYSFVSSNGVGYSVAEKEKGNLVHPRSFGTFPRFLGHYVRDKKIISLEKAIRKITGGPAEKIGFSKRGLLQEGYKADITVFDLKKINDLSRNESPFKYPKGIDWVIVNGKVTVAKGKLVEGVRSGQILRKM